jgi:hypothetical protein
VLAGVATCATQADTASVTKRRPIVWDIRAVKSGVPDAPQVRILTRELRRPDSLRVQKREKVDAFVGIGTDNMLYVRFPHPRLYSSPLR